MVSGNEDCCKEVISEVNSLAQKIDELCQDDSFILGWFKFFITISLIALTVGCGVQMRLHLFSLIKSLAEKIDELMKEVKNISKSGGGTGDPKQPGGGTGDTKQPGGDTGDTKKPGGGTGDTKQPGGGTGDTKKPGGGTGDTKQPGNGTDNKNVPQPPYTRDPATIGDSKKTITGISAPLYIYITHNGKVFITGWGDGHVHIFDKDGNFQKKFKPPIGGLIGVCGNSKDDRIYVASYSGSKIYEYTIDGELIGDKISVTTPVGVSVDSDGKFYVSQQGTGKIYVFNPDGSKSLEMSGIGTYPRKIQFDSDGNIRVPDFYTGTVFVVSKSGTVLSKLKIEGVTYGEGLYVDSDDNMYVCDRSSPGAVYICDKNGKQIKVIKGFKGAGDAFIAPDGTLWITDFTGNKVYLY